MMTLILAAARALANALKASGAPLNAAKMGLYTTNVNFTNDATVAGLVEATFPGYARSGTITWLDAQTKPDYSVELIGDVKTFTATGMVTGTQTVYGFFYVDGSGNLLAGDRLANPYTFVDSPDTLTLVPVWQQGVDVI
jgi:hypothetical protein